MTVPSSLHRSCAVALWVACSAARAADDATLDDEPEPARESVATGGLAGRAAVFDALAAPRYTRSLPGLSATVVLPSGNRAARPAELTELSQRWWLSRQRADIGVGLGMVGYNVVTPEARADDAQTLRNAVPSVNVGIRYRVSPGSAIYADAASARGLYGKGSAAYFTKLGVEWQGSPRSGWGLAHGGIGLRLDSGKTMTMRVKGGGLGVFLRSQF